MKKVLALAISLCLVAFSFAGCGSKETGDKNSSNSGSSVIESNTSSDLENSVEPESEANSDLPEASNVDASEPKVVDIEKVAVTIPGNATVEEKDGSYVITLEEGNAMIITAYIDSERTEREDQKAFEAVMNMGMLQSVTDQKILDSTTTEIAGLKAEALSVTGKINSSACSAMAVSFHYEGKMYSFSYIGLMSSSQASENLNAFSDMVGTMELK